MENLQLYLWKANGLIIMFFLAYHFLLRKETFFNNNRWFLISGLISSALFPLYFIKKIVFIERPKVSINDIIALSDTSSGLHRKISYKSIIETINWIDIIVFIYVIVSILLTIKVIIDLFSLFILLHKKKIEKKESYSYIDLQQDIAPFSFFNFIVYNSTLYSPTELQSILQHEKVHSSQKHSIDVLIAKLFTIVFWFNPFMWLYQKAIIQNLEFIADNEAIQKIEDKKVYQIALLKVVTHHNCLPITNHFYQSLIKKRIVMLNKNQSNRKNVWKYAVVFPALAAFVLLFQVKVVAQERKEKTNPVIEEAKAELAGIEISKTDTDKDLAETKKLLLENKKIDFQYSELTRNEKGEITHIKISFDDGKGNNGISEFQGKPTIETIYFSMNKDENGKDKIGFTKNYPINKSTQYIATVINNTDNDDNINERLKIFNSEGITFKIVKTKRNSKNEIIQIKIEGSGNGENYNFSKNQSEPIKQIFLLKQVGSSNKLIIKEKKDLNSNGIEVTDNVVSVTVADENSNKSPFVTQNDNNDDVVVIRDRNNAGVKVPGSPTLFLVSKPAIFIDDKPILEENNFKTINEIDPNTIARINVLKGDDAIKKYGKSDFAEKGVIEITTKKYLPYKTKSWNNPEVESMEIGLDSKDPDARWYSLTDEYKKQNITINVSNIKRNKDNKIIAIDIEMKSKDGRLQKLSIDRITPIIGIGLFVDKTKNKNWDFGIKELDKEVND